MLLSLLNGIPFFSRPLYSFLSRRVVYGLQRYQRSGSDIAIDGRALRIKGEFTAYVHFPFCSSVCRYCSFNRTLDIGLTQQYCNSLLREIGLVASTRTAPEARLSSIYFGGGTPSLIPPATLAEICQRLLGSFAHESNTCMTLECSPESLKLENIEAYRRMGINRLSLGVQSLNSAVLSEMGRPPHSQSIIELLKALPGAGLENFSVDLMYGFVIQSTDIFLADLAQIIECNPAHITLYPLVGGSSPKINETQREIKQKKMYTAAQSLLHKSGYVQYSTEDFARSPEKWDFYQMDCWKVPSKQMVAFGTAGFGSLDHHFYIKDRNTHNYIDRITKGEWPISTCYPVGGTQEACARFLQGLRYLEVDRTALQNQYGIDPFAQHIPVLNAIKELRLIEVGQQKIHLSEHAFFLYSLLWAKTMLMQLHGDLS